MIKKDCKIMGFENLYHIYEDGRIYSVRSMRFLKHKPDAKGYVRGTLHPHRSSGLRTRIFFVHRLVLIHFVSPPPFARAECNHKDHDPTNNHYKNLEWVTHAENIKKSYDIGGRVGAMSGKKRGPWSDEVKKKLAEQKNRRIWMKDRDGERSEFGSIQVAADSLGLDRRSINRFLYGKSKSRAGYTFGFVEVVKKEKGKHGLPSIKSTVINDHNPLKEVPVVDFSQLGAGLIRIAKNLYANKDGYLVKYSRGGDLVEQRFKDRISVLNAYGLGSPDRFDVHQGDHGVEHSHKAILGDGIYYDSVYAASKQLGLIPRFIHRAIEAGLPYKDIKFTYK